MRMFALAAAAVVLVLATLALGSSPASAQGSIEEQDLVAAEARWAENGNDSYHVSYADICFCAHGGTSRVATVSNGEVTQVSVPAGTSQGPAGRTVEQMFADIRAAIVRGDLVKATYDPADGHPVVFETGVLALDAGIRVVVSGLVPIETPISCGGLPATMLGTNGDDVLSGSRFDDVIIAFDGDDRIYGREGDDTICADAGRDRAYGEAGDDHLLGGDDIDYLWGGPGTDTLEGNGGSDRLRGGDDVDYLRGGSGADRMWGNDGNDEMLGQGGQDEMWGGAGDDVIQGNWQSDKIWGGDGNDTIGAAEGKDDVYGGAGDDVMYGGNNTDVLFGGPGLDTLSGGPGTDTLDGGLDRDAMNGGPHTDTCVRSVGDTLLSCQVREWGVSDRWVLTDIDSEEFAFLAAYVPYDREILALDRATGTGSLFRSSFCPANDFSFTLDGTNFDAALDAIDEPCGDPAVIEAIAEAIDQAFELQFSNETMTISGTSATLFFERSGFAASTDLQAAQVEFETAVASYGESYQVDYDVICFCLPSSTITATVVNGTPTSFVAATGNPVLDFDQYTVRDMFDVIQDAIDRSAARIDVSYGDHGVPESINVDYVRQIADEELGINVSRFVFTP